MFSIATFTVVHVVISLLGIASGFVVAYGLVTNRRLETWTLVFLTTTIATSVTGFMFPVDRFTPAHALGIISLILLAVAVAARYRYRMSGRWRVAFVATSVAAFYLNFFVLIAQSFQKVPALRALAPTQSEPPFAVAQLVALVVFVGLGIVASRNFRS
jgi:hypothetical protein